MRQEGLLCQLERQFAITTDSAHRWPRYPNLIQELVQELVLDHLDQSWVADITYIRAGRS